MVGLMKTDYELEDLSYEECNRPHGGGSEMRMNQKDAIHIDNYILHVIIELKLIQLMAKGFTVKANAPTRKQRSGTLQQSKKGCEVRRLSFAFLDVDVLISF